MPFFHQPKCPWIYDPIKKAPLDLIFRNLHGFDWGYYGKFKLSTNSSRARKSVPSLILLKQSALSSSFSISSPLISSSNSIERIRRSRRSSGHGLGDRELVLPAFFSPSASVPRPFPVSPPPAPLLVLEEPRDAAVEGEGEGERGNAVVLARGEPDRGRRVSRPEGGPLGRHVGAPAPAPGRRQGSRSRGNRWGGDLGSSFSFSCCCGIWCVNVRGIGEIRGEYGFEFANGWILEELLHYRLNGPGFGLGRSYLLSLHTE